MLRLGGVYDLDLTLEAVHLDAAETSAKRLEAEMFIDTAELLLSGYEEMYGLSPAAGSTLEQRRSAVKAKARASGELRRAYFENIAAGRGYNINSATDPHLRFVEGSYPAFRADLSRADIDLVYDQYTGHSSRTVRVLGTDVESDSELQAIFEDLKASTVTLNFENE
jgi:hypothetical protein